MSMLDELCGLRRTISASVQICQISVHSQDSMQNNLAAAADLRNNSECYKASPFYNVDLSFIIVESSCVVLSESSAYLRFSSRLFVATHWFFAYWQ